VSPRGVVKGGGDHPRHLLNPKARFDHIMLIKKYEYAWPGSLKINSTIENTPTQDIHALIGSAHDIATVSQVLIRSLYQCFCMVGAATRKVGIVIAGSMLTTRMPSYWCSAS
jgi:hypothetical protein